VSEPRNRLLAALPPADFQAFASQLERVEVGRNVEVDEQ
jgi:hypothetical protein